MVMILTSLLTIAMILFVQVRRSMMEFYVIILSKDLCLSDNVGVVESVGRIDAL